MDVELLLVGSDDDEADVLDRLVELGEALIKRVKAGDFKESELWCLSRLGARKLFYGPINLVLPPATVTRWVEALLKVPAAGDALAAMARRTEDPTRDIPAATRESVKSKLQALPQADRLLAVVEGLVRAAHDAADRVHDAKRTTPLSIGRND